MKPLMKSRLPFAPAFLIFCLTTAAAAANPEGARERTATPSIDLAYPPPLDSKIVQMMKTNTVGSVEVRIYFVENWEITPVQKAQVFFSMLEKSGPDDQRKLAHAAVTHVANTNYALLRRYFLDSQLPRPVLSVFMTDTLKRSNRIKLPVLLTLAQVSAHPMQTEARQLLSVYLGQSHGTNWARWEQTMLAWMQGNPD